MINKISIIIFIFFLYYSNNVRSQNVNNLHPKELDNKISNFLGSGKFLIGANYWSSHAGTAMWSDWRPDIIEQDFKKLSGEGIKTLRIFPIWSEFQPIGLLFGSGGERMEYRIGEESLTDDPEGSVGVSKAMMNHFDEFVILAEKFDIKLIVSLLTGQMSYRVFAPPAFVSRNLLTDPEVVKWETRYVRYFVSRFKSAKAIIAWELGNESELLDKVTSSEEAWCWATAMTNTIKAVDNTRPVISGTYSASPDQKTPWNIQDMAEITDILSVHSYQIFTPYAESEPLNTFRPILASTVKNILNESVGLKPSFIEEFGTLGPLSGTDRVGGVKTGFMRSNLFSLWAYDCKGLLWWCAFDQGHLTRAPYDWNSRGSEYGLWYPDGNPKPILGEIKAFSKFLSGFDYSPLPERIIDGVCILTNGQDSWATAYSSFLLAKQAGLDIEFQYSTQPIKESKLYFLPSIKGGMTISRHRMQELLEKVRNGAVLYISNDDGNIGPYFPEFTGLEVKSYIKSPITDFVTIDDGDKKKTGFELRTEKKLVLTTEKAKILGTDQDGNSAFTCMDYGKGKVFFLNYPLEKYLSTKAGAFDGQKKNNYFKIYSLLKNSIISSKVVSIENANIGITEHPMDSNKRVVIAVNYFPSPADVSVKIEKGWKLSRVLYGEDLLKAKQGEKFPLNLNFKGNDAVVFTIEKVQGVTN